MSLTRRAVLAAAPGLAQATTVPPDLAGEEVRDLVHHATQAHVALMRGDIDVYRRHITLSADFMLMSPFGGRPTRAADLSPARWEAMGRFFRNGREATLELLQAWHTPELVVLAVIERAHVEVGGLAGQPWSLRVTLVFRRDQGRWLLAHRHADPLVQGVSLEEAAAVARARGPA